MSALVWQVEWQVAGADRRGVALRVLGLLALTAVIATGAIPSSAGSAALVALFVGYGMLRSAHGLFADGQSGLARRVLNGGVSPASYMLQRAAASAALSLLGLVPALVVVALSLRAGAVEILVVVTALAATLWIASLLGVVVGSISASFAELLVLVGVVLVLLLHMSGVFHTPDPAGLGAVLEAASPFGALHGALAAISSGGRVSGAGTVAAWAVLMPGLLGLSASRLAAFRTRAA